MKMVSMGSKKKAYRSIKLAAEAHDISYMTAYMRIRAGLPVAKALKQPVRAYSKAT